MKAFIILFLIISGLGLTACYPGSPTTQMLTQSSLPGEITPSTQATTPLLPAKTEIPFSPTDSVTRTPTQTLTPSLTATQTSTSTAPPTQTQTPAPHTPTLIATATDDPFANRLLPDLQTLPPKDLRLLYDPDSGRALIRFTNSIWNSGPGRLELIGVPNQSNERFQVSQRVYANDTEMFDEYEVGDFIFSSQHEHWHLERFAQYELWSVSEQGSLESLLSSGEKVSWCVIDEAQVETDFPDQVISTRRNYYNCEGEVQGLSVGWVDIYEHNIPRQWVEMTPLEDGLYALVSTANPDHLLYEEDYSNNTASVYFEIQELRLKIVEDQSFEETESL